jgi:hypothetical protein
VVRVLGPRLDKWSCVRTLGVEGFGSEVDGVEEGEDVGVGS